MTLRSKRKVRVKAHELSDVDVELISLVKRPASRKPFGLMKSENMGGSAMSRPLDTGLFDLTRIFKREVQEPVVTSVLINGPVSDGVIEVLKSNGFSVDEPQVTEGVTMFPQDVEFSGEPTVVKLTDNIALGVSVVKMDGDFAEMVAARGYFPALCLATDLLQDELSKAVAKADNPSDAASKIGAVVSDFGSFMQQMVGALPDRVFKTELALNALAEGSSETQADEGQGEGDKVEKGEGGQADEGTGDQGQQDQGDAGGDAGAQAGEGDAGAGDGGQAEQGDQGSGQADEPKVDLDQIAKSVAESVMGALQPELDTIKGQVGSLTEKVTEVEGKVEKADKTLKTTIFGGTQQADDRNIEKTEEYEPVGTMIDTGYGFGVKRDEPRRARR